MNTDREHARVVIRRGASSDVEALLPMVRSICAMHEHMDPARFAFVDNIVELYRVWLPKRCADPRSVVFVAEIAGAIAGFIIAQAEESIYIYKVREFGWVHDLWVEPADRGRGVGGLLVRAAVEGFAAMGITQVRGETAWQNADARKLLERTGFRPATIEMLYESRDR